MEIKQNFVPKNTKELNPPKLPLANISNASLNPVNILIPTKQITLSQEQQPLPFATNVNQAYSNTNNINPEYSSMAPELVPIILQPYPAITK